jgi:membrane protein implicated in regulation of membrane protease activity
VSPFIWLGITVALGLAEAAAPALVCLWFCIGAAVAFIASFFATDLLVQVIVFVVCSALGLAALRPFMKRSSESKEADAVTNSDEYVGRTVTVVQRVPQGGRGRVKLADVSWIARTADGSGLPSGARARVVAVESTVLVVEALPQQ